MTLASMANAMQQALGAPTPNMADRALMDWIALREQTLRVGYELFDNYYRGDQETRLTDRLLQFINSQTQFRDNFCEVIVDVMAERLEVIGFESGDDATDEWLWKTWQANRSDALQITVHTEAPKLGDAYVLVDWDDENKRPRFTRQDANMVIPRYNPETGLLDVVSKKWTETPQGGKPRTRLNLYYPDRVEKFVAEGNGGWEEFLDEGEDTWPQAWTMEGGKPLGVAVVHFRNKPGSDDFGMSELENVTPMQDVLNKSFIDLLQIEDVMAWPQRWTIDVEKPTSGQLKVVPGAVWDLQSANEDISASVGQFDAADITGVHKTIEVILQHIAGRSRTPQHLFQVSGDFPSGEAMKTAESGLVSKVKQRQVGFGNSWEDVMMLAMRIQTRFGTGVTFPDDAMPETIWEDPESRNEVMFTAALEAKQRLGVTQEQLLRELGYDQAQIEQMADDRQAQKVAETNLGAEIIRNFNRGEV